MNESKIRVEPKLNGTKIPKVIPGKKRKFDLEFKKQIAMRVKSGESIQDIAKHTGAGESQIRNWSQGKGLGSMGGARHEATSRGRKTNKTRTAGSSADGYLVIPKPVKDAIYYLERAEAWTYQALREEKIDRIDTAHDYARQALRELVKLVF